MPMVIEPLCAACGVTPAMGQHLRPDKAGSAAFPEEGISRRQLLLMAAGMAAAMPAWAGAAKNTTLVAAWQQQEEQHIGLLSAGDA
ncbi:MAG TPA: hypothetical protein VIN35_04810, partial [Hydrogenophaga sp.]